MQQNLDVVINLVFGHEGGYVDHPKDPGGATKYGITAKTLGAWRQLGRKATPAEVKALTLDEARKILIEQYARPIRFDDLPSGLDYAVFDFAVNAGPAQAVRTLQRVLRVARDGVMGTHTLAAIRTIDATTLIPRYNKARLSFLKGLSTWRTFGRGWTDRVNAATPTAVKMALGEAPMVVASTQVATAKADPADTKISATTGGKGLIATALGALGAAAGQAKDALLPLAGEHWVLDWTLAGFTILGVAAVIGGIAISTYAQTRRIASGTPV